MASIRKRGNKYHVQVRRNGLAPVSRTFHIRTDAEEWARFMDSKADRGDLPAPIKVLQAHKVRDILERYRDEVIVKKRSAEVETYIVNAFLRDPIAGLSLAQITPAHFSSYRDKRMKVVQAETINREMGVIKHAFDIAEREWDIPIKQNPIKNLKKMKVQSTRTRRLSEDDYAALQGAIQNTRNDHIKPLIDFAIETGMRRGEILKIQWQHINYQTRTLFIPVTKNGYSRTIPLTPKALNILESIQKEGSSRPFPISDNAAKKAWQRLVDRSGLVDFHFHDLRHEAISRFFERGLSVPEVALISGHRDFRMLFRYTHLKAEDIVRKFISDEKIVSD